MGKTPACENTSSFSSSAGVWGGDGLFQMVMTALSRNFGFFSLLSLTLVCAVIPCSCVGAAAPGEGENPVLYPFHPGACEPQNLPGLLFNYEYTAGRQN